MVKEKNGPALFGCWIALVEVGSTCNPRGDLSKYSIEALTDLSMMPIELVKQTLLYCSQVLDWIEDIENLDKSVKNLDKCALETAVGSSILFSSVLSNSQEEGMQGEKPSKARPTIEEVKAYCFERKNTVDHEKWFDFYSSKGWMIGKNRMKDWKAAVRTWEKGQQPTRQGYGRQDITKADIDDAFSLTRRANGIPTI
jgi:hypothetical protein